MFSNNFIKQSFIHMAIGISFLSATSHADQLFNDDVIVKASLCVGSDCVSGENFNFDTIRMKENNTRIRFQDTSTTGSFPSVDWQLTANQSNNGGINLFSIDNITTGKTPFVVVSGSDNNSIYVRDNSWVGFNTNAPVVTMQVTTGNSPTLRLDQDGSSGFAAQAWDVGGNETNFFVRDVTSGGKLPLRIRTGAPNASLYVDVDGDIGFGTTTPDGLFDIAHPSDANNHALLINSTGNFGININNGFNPRALFDIQTTGGVSRFMVQSDGKVGIGMSTSAVPAGMFEVESSGSSKFIVNDSGNVGIGTDSPSSRFDIRNTANSATLFTITDEGKTTVTSSFFDADATTCGGANSSFAMACGRFNPLFLIEETNAATQGRMMYLLKANQPSWFGAEDTTQNKIWYATNASDGYVFVLYDKTSNEILEKMKIENGGNVTAAGTFINGSSKFIKENFAKVDTQSVLEKLEQLEITTWKYKSEKDGISHIGPMSQDFHALFNVGANDEGISNVDASGVSMAAIKALYERVKALEAKLSQYE